MSTINPISLAVSQAMSPMSQLVGKSGTSAQTATQSSQMGDLFKKALEKASQSDATSKDLAQRIQLEDPSVSVEQVALASNESSLHFEFIRQSRNRIVQGYNDLMNMPV
jgi:flagellar hook-basal body complex protein FliE